jgi:hypothetical protein
MIIINAGKICQNAFRHFPDICSRREAVFELKNISICVLRNVLHRLYQDVLCLKIVAQFYSRTLNVILSILVRIMTFPAIIFTKLADAQHHYLQIFCNLTHIGKKKS